jgi:ABC-type phosphate transport system substrate-binding protein
MACEDILATLAIAGGMAVLAAQVPLKPAAFGTIRIWGHGSRTGSFAENLVGLWNGRFRRLNPGVRFEVALRGDSAAIGGLYTGAADIALMGREIRPIELQGFEQAAHNVSQFFQQAVMGGSKKWNCDLRELRDLGLPDGSTVDAGRQILEALAKDPYGIAFANVLHANPDVRTVAVAESGPYVEPTKENVWRRAYPITRFTNVVINRRPGKPVEPRLKEFVRYILSRDGMGAVVRDGSYLPLIQELIHEQLRKLE